MVLLTKTWIQYLESGITYLIYCLFLALVELTTYRFQCLVYFLFQLHDIGRYYFFTYLLTWLFTMYVFKIWLRRTLNGFLLSGRPGCHLGEENKKLYWTLQVAASVVKRKALSENLASTNRHALNTAWMKFHAPIYIFFQFCRKHLLNVRVLVSSTDRLVAFWARVRFFLKKGFKLL